MITTILKKNRTLNLFTLLLLIMPMPVTSTVSVQAELPAAMIDAIKTGNSAQLSGYFNTSIELAIPGKEDIFSAQQAELIIKDFFAKHVPSAFVILHKGGKEGSQYAIGNLTTAKGNFRVTLWIKVKDNKPYIHQLRFEEENAE